MTIAKESKKKKKSSDLNVHKNNTNITNTNYC